MKGVWITRTAAAIANGVSQTVFNRKVLPTLRIKKKKPNSVPLVFLPTDKMLPMYIETYKDDIVEEDDTTQQVEQVLGDITNLAEVNYTDPNSALQEARLDNLRARTSILTEKLEARKREMFSEWTEKFFGIFAMSFSKFKNELISLHLNEEQLNTLNEKLEYALKTMKDGLDAINAEWMDEDEEEKK